MTEYMKVDVQPLNDDTRDGGVRKSHPAFGTVQVCRTMIGGMGGAKMFDSAVEHNYVLTVTVSRADADRFLSQDWIHPKEDLLSFQMTEAQWASLVSAIGQGEGVPCTLVRTEQGEVPAIADTPSPNYSDDFRDAMQEYTKSLKVLRATVERIDRLRSLNKDLKQELRDSVTSLIALLESSLPFILNQFQEHGEHIARDMLSSVHGRVRALEEAVGKDHVRKMLEDSRAEMEVPKLARPR